jgi:hypothetical protein
MFWLTTVLLVCQKIENFVDEFNLEHYAHGGYTSSLTGVRPLKGQIGSLYHLNGTMLMTCSRGVVGE